MLPRDDSETIGDFSITTVVVAPPWYENCYLVKHLPSGRQLVIDPGGDAADILAAIEANGGNATDILLTHGHPDHLGAAHEIQAALGIPCRAHQEERAIIDGVANWAGALMQRRIRGPEAVEYFAGEPELAFGDFTARVLFTPGHTPGGVCYLFEGFIFTGDTLFNQGVGRTDLPGGDGRTLGASITRLLKEAAPKARLYSGHGPAWSVSEARPWWERAAAYGYF